MTRWHFFLQFDSVFNLAYFWKKINQTNNKLKIIQK